MISDCKKLLSLKIVNLLLILLFCKCAVIFAQDIHFSQIQSTPLVLNPANTGSSLSNVRFTNDYRSQWQRIDYPYNTLMLAIDGSFTLLNRQSGIGAMMVHDQSSGNYLNVDKFFVSLSHSVYYRNHRLILGVQPGFVAKKYSNENLVFGNQFDPTSEDYSLPFSETGLNEDFRYIDLNAGVLWQSRIKNLKTSAGFSINHLTRPVESFYNENDADPLPLKYTLHGGVFIPLNSRFALNPQGLISYTGGGREFNAGTLLDYYPQTDVSPIQKVFALSAFRINPVKNFDAFIVGAGASVAGFDVCVSYDLNISSLRKVSNFQGGYEISVVYKAGNSKTKSTDEPCFML
ncbi:MAG: PorP/SprF family type IX secretion system membrane protein [Bacteroidales bacterium]|nr:PorP/SprF family type IX secretion system membrane protein [Bacteroidales bacterium]MBN2820096.1 PorP/SprF family type IX secretion system membrane protein [Bacteroidales bacterium]